jgi:NAD(P)-dependent dehydrogenase (short-subunit alcohol dehydrogenase family)
MSEPSAQPGAVVVTGASTGIGRATALHLDSLGFQVLAGIRREADADSLRSAGSERLEPLHIDVTDSGSIAAAAVRVNELTGEAGLAGLVNNAGTVIAGPLEVLPIEELRRQLEINLVGQVAVTQAMLPALRRASGRIVFMSSIGGRIALPFNAPYHASKFGIEAVGDSLRQELRPWGIEVSIVEPGSVATPIWAKGSSEGDRLSEGMSEDHVELYGETIDRFRTAALEIGEEGIPPERVAEVVAQALTAKRPKTRYLVGRDAKVRARVRRVIPDRVFDRLVARQLGS